MAELYGRERQCRRARVSLFQWLPLLLSLSGVNNRERGAPEQQSANVDADVAAVPACLPALRPRRTLTLPSERTFTRRPPRRHAAMLCSLSLSLLRGSLVFQSSIHSPCLFCGGRRRRQAVGAASRQRRTAVPALAEADSECSVPSRCRLPENPSPLLLQLRSHRLLSLSRSARLTLFAFHRLLGVRCLLRGSPQCHRHQ